MFSKACEYGIRASIYIGRHSDLGLKVRVKAVAEAINSPEAFTAKILQDLAKQDILQSSTGPTGGYEISSSRKVTLLDIVTALDGVNSYRACTLGLAECDEKQPCPLHQQFVAIKSEVEEMLSTTTIEDLSKGVELGHFFLKG